MRLRITPAEGDPFDYVLERDSVTVGRSSTADLALSDPFLSRHHARLSRRNDQLLVEDLGSRNGTFLNDLPVQGLTAVKPGDVIRLSASSIALASDRASISTATTHESGIGNTIFKPATQLLEEEISSSTERLDSAEALRSYAQRLETLRDVHEAVAGSLTEQALLDMILDRIFEHLKPQQGVVYLKEADGEYYQAATRALPGHSTDIPLSRTLVHEVLDKGMAALVFDAATDQRFAASESIMMSGIRSMVAAPLLAEQKPIGMIVLNSKVAVKQFVEQDMELLASLASVASLKLRNIELLERDAQRRQLEAELALARHIQVSLLPQTLPTFEGWSIIGRNIPSRGVSGDYYVVVPRKEDTECVLFMADVSGKGIAASIVTASLEALAVAPIESGAPPDEICDQLCRRLYKRTPPEKYATAFCAVLEPATGRLSYTNAGHNTALLVHTDGTIEDLTTCGLPIALLPEATYERREVQLEPGAGLLIYTDGITEAENKAGDEYGLDRLRTSYAKNFRLPIAELAEAIQYEVSEFVGEVPFADDRTMLLLQRVGPAALVTEDRRAAGLEAELDTLFSAPLEEFTARRDALAKRLRASGAAEEARRVKALRKPTAVAWAINRLHLESNGLAEIEEVSAALRAALRDPRSAEDRRSAIESRRRALERATAAVVDLLEGAGSSVSPALLRRIERTLLALATGASASAGDAPVPGRLHQELEPPGFEAILDAPAPAVAAARPVSSAQPPAAAPSPAKRPAPTRPAKDAAAPARAAAKPRPTPAAATPVVRPIVRDSKEVRAAQAALDRAEGDLERATDRVDAARMKVTDAEKSLAAARQQVDAERRELAAVRSRRDEARRELDRVKRA